MALSRRTLLRVLAGLPVVGALVPRAWGEKTDRLVLEPREHFLRKPQLAYAEEACAGLSETPSPQSLTPLSTIERLEIRRDQFGRVTGERVTFTTTDQRLVDAFRRDVPVRLVGFEDDKPSRIVRLCTVEMSYGESYGSSGLLWRIEAEVIFFPACYPEPITSFDANPPRRLVTYYPTPNRWSAWA